jgi:hypothetical protein
VDTSHRGQINHKPPVAHGIARHTVAAAANRHQQMILASEMDGRDDVRDARAPRDQSGSFVDHPVEDLARQLVARIASLNQFAAQS